MTCACSSAVLEFPVQYATLPPVLRFMSVPYDPNAAREGRVLCAAVEGAYCQTLKYVDMIKGVKMALTEPEIEGTIGKDVAKQYVSERGRSSAPQIANN
jgi:ubiquitin-protein ligase